jgi:hypothetical protein
MSIGRSEDVPLFDKPLTEKHRIYKAYPENFTPPTHNPDDCQCGGGKPGAVGRSLIANCPCCDGVQILVEEVCGCDGSLHKMRVILPPSSEMRIRYIDNVKAIE